LEAVESGAQMQRLTTMFAAWQKRSSTISLSCWTVFVKEISEWSLCVIMTADGQ
jgi:hypothetical protein